MNNDMRYIGSKIRAKRKALDLSQEELGELAGIHPSYVGQIERGIRVPSVLTLIEIARALGTKPSTLLEEDEPGHAGIIQSLRELVSNAPEDKARLILEIARVILTTSPK